MSTRPPFAAWAEKHGVHLTPAATFDYREALGPEQCDYAAAALLSSAHELAALLNAGVVADGDLVDAHAVLFDRLRWALRYLGIAPDGFPEYRATVRGHYLSDTCRPTE